MMKSLLGGLLVAVVLVAVVLVARAPRATSPSVSVAAACRGDAFSVEAALDAYNAQEGQYPASTRGIDRGGAG
jgi:hypothetical protein